MKQLTNRIIQNNPLFQRAMQMANGKSNDEIRTIAENLCKQRGININDAMKQFQSMFGMNLK